MRIVIKPYTQSDTGAVRDFNDRLASDDFNTRFTESRVPAWLPEIDDRKMYQERFLAWEGDFVRGAYALKHQEFSFYGDIVSIADYQLPMSEGIVDKKYSLVGVQIYRDAMRRQPKLYGLGMGGYEEPLPRLLKAFRWKMFSVPFYFKVIRPFNFLRKIAFLRRSGSKRAVMDILAFTGAGWLSIKTFQAHLKTKDPEKSRVSCETVEEFSEWADGIWDDNKAAYAMIAVRDSSILNILYPRNSERFIRLKVMKDGEVIGWAVLLDTQMSDHRQFGSLRVGSIADCLALPENANKVIASATEYLRKAGVDLIVSNQSHIAWCLALKNAGFIKGPTNFIFAASKELSELLEPFEDNSTKVFLNRGDGDGPATL